MPIFTVGVCKGFAEPCPPYRQAMIFGQPLGSPNTSWWNCMATIVQPTSTFDLSTFLTYSEVVGAIVGIQDVPGGIYYLRIVWYRERDSKILFEWSYQLEIAPNGWVYGTSWIGYHPNEIWENGNYSVDMYVEGPIQYYTSRPFTVTGIPVTPPAEPPPELYPPPVELPPAIPEPAYFWNDAVQASLNIGTWFRNIGNTAEGWIPPFNVVSSWFLWISNQFEWLAYYFSLARNWTIEAWSRILSFLDSTGIIALLQTWLTWAADAWAWVADAVNHINWQLNEWWGSVGPAVWGWVEDVRNWATGRLDSLWFTLQPVWAWFTSFEDQLPTLNEVVAWFGSWPDQVVNLVFQNGFALWTNVQDWVNSRLAELNITLEGWQDVRDEVVLFIQDPLDYLKDKLESWFWD